MKKLTITKLDKGAQHRLIENDHFKIETLPQSGQIWHIWNKLGSNRSWHHEEWTDNVDKGGDPCHWAPNCWVGYPQRVMYGYETKAGGEIPNIDWHYSFGWDNPETHYKEENDEFVIIRRGVIPPHPEHTDPNVYRENKPLIWGEVTYRFFGNEPYFYQSSKIRTLAPVPVFFIRNCQFVFRSKTFSHLIVMPESHQLKPHDTQEPIVLPLMSEFNAKPLMVDHSFSNILPSKLDYASFFHHDSKDGFALFQMEEKNTNLHTGKPTYGNHCTLFTEQKDWAVYFCRTFSYTNQRFNPENMTYLPAGEEYSEANFGLLFCHKDIPSTIELLNKKSKFFHEKFQAEKNTLEFS